MTDIVLSSEVSAKIKKSLNKMLVTSGAHSVLLIDKSGQLIASAGDPSTLDIMALSALTAANFGATSEIAKLLGEEEFSVLYHKGKNESINFSTVGDELIMVTLFDNRTSLGLVRLRINSATQELLEIFKGILY